MSQQLRKMETTIYKPDLVWKLMLMFSIILPRLVIAGIARAIWIWISLSNSPGVFDECAAKIFESIQLLQLLAVHSDVNVQ